MHRSTWQPCGLRELVELPLVHYLDLCTNLGINTPQGVLLTSPSGCGKQAMTHAVAAKTGTYFFVIKGPKVIISKRTGESKMNLCRAFEDARENMANYNGRIIVINKIDSIAPRRNKEAGGEVEKGIVSQLLTFPSSRVIIIATIDTRTNIISRQIIHSK